jgi:hypothetical protein
MPVRCNNGSGFFLYREMKLQKDSTIWYAELMIPVAC